MRTNVARASRGRKYLAGLLLRCSCKLTFDFYGARTSSNSRSSAVAEMGDRLATIDMDRKVGVCPFLGGAGSLCNTLWPGPRPTLVPQVGLGSGHIVLDVAGTEAYLTSMPSFILIRPTVWQQYTTSSRLATTDMARKFGGGAAVPVFRGYF